MSNDRKRRWTITADKFLDQDQIAILLDHLTQERDLAIARDNNTQAIRDYYTVRVLLETGVRVFEFCELVDGSFQGQKLTVKRGKGGKARTVLLTRGTCELLKEWLAVKARLGHSAGPTAPLFPSRYGASYTTRGVQKRIKEVFRAAGLPSHLSVHSLRHTYCSLLLASGKVSPATVRNNMGHHSLAVTDLYSHAIGDLSHIGDILPSRSSEKSELSEPPRTSTKKKANDPVTAFLRKVNFK